MAMTTSTGLTSLWTRAPSSPTGRCWPCQSSTLVVLAGKIQLCPQARARAKPFQRGGLNEPLNYDGVFKAAPGFAQVANVNWTSN